MKSASTNHLKLYVEDAASTQPPRSDDWPGLAALCQSFEQATGWSLQLTPPAPTGTSVWSNPGPGHAPGTLIAKPPVTPPSAAPKKKPAAKGKKKATRRASAPKSSRPSQSPAAPMLSTEQIQPLVDGLNSLMNELHRTRVALWQREAELAAGIPVKASDKEGEQLANCLQSVLRSGAESVGCQAAAIYMLDESTSELKLRGSVGLPAARLLEPPRDLRSSIADLEALLGNAVVLEDTELLPHWQPPENFPAAACVPISTSTMPLGTMWVFCDHKRDFTAEQTSLLEIVAGRIAAELERSVLLGETAKIQQSQRDAQRAVRWQRSRLPQVEPLLDRWLLAGWTTQLDRVGGEFFDWNVLPSGNLGLAVGAADGTAIEASLTSAALHSALRAHAASAADPKQLVRNMNDTFWTASCGDQTGSLAYATIHPETGQLQFSATGRAGAVVLAGKETKIVLPDSPALGTDPDSSFSLFQRKLPRSSLLVLFTIPPDVAFTPRRPPAIVSTILEAVRKNRRHKPAKLVTAIRDAVTKTETAPDRDHSFLVIKRTR